MNIHQDGTGSAQIAVIYGPANHLGGVPGRAENRLSYRPFIFLKKLQKSREISDFKAFSGGLEGDRTLDLCDANAALSQLSYEPVFV